MIARTFASVLPRQSPSSLILLSIDAEADSTGTGLFMLDSTLRTSSPATHSSLARERLQQPVVRGSAPADCRRQKMYDSAHSTTVAAAQLHTAGLSPTAR